jgi:hypothetical protein
MQPGFYGGMSYSLDSLASHFFSFKIPVIQSCITTGFNFPSNYDFMAAQ